MYEFLILSQLARCPMHGYRIAKIIGDIVGPRQRVQWGALYPLLGRLERDGLIAAAPCGDDAGRKKEYALTERGRERLHELLLDTSRHQGEYDTLFAHKVSSFPLLTPEERVYLCRHYAVFAQQNVDYLIRERDDLHQHSGLASECLDAITRVMEHRIDYWQRERAWAELLLVENQEKESA
ncbi:MAG TPA: PadR family transcriptional regulator [Chloroflexota bacterium]|nr:PadR family transcriptional regulator [Chloroflexota bacterium]